MVERLLWFWHSDLVSTGWTPLLRVALVCSLVYQLDLCVLLGGWLLRKLCGDDRDFSLAPDRCKSALLVMPTLLRQEDELEGLMHAAESCASNGYPGPLTIVLCIDGSAERPQLFQRLQAWAEHKSSAGKVRFVVSGLPQRGGKAVAMEHGVAHVLQLVQQRQLPEMPEVFFNMDADSTLGPRALERMVHTLTRPRRWLGPRMIVTSNVVVPIEQCYQGVGSLLSPSHWLAMLVAREYLSSITCARFNCKLLPGAEVSGALYCTWTQVHLCGPYYARFMQQLSLRDYARWWLGGGAPRFSEFRGEPLPEAMSGPGDDTWIAWMASVGHWTRDGKLSFDAPQTPLHALGRLALRYVFRAVGYSPLAKVYTKTPTRARVLFKQRLRWNSSRIQDMFRWLPSHLYHWNVGLPLSLAVSGVVFSILGVATGVLAVLFGLHLPPNVLPHLLLIALGYALTRVLSSVTALIVSESPARDWLKLIALPLGGPYHFCFNTLTLLTGYARDVLGFGEHTNFAPETTLRKAGLARIALAYRLRRAFLLCIRSAVYGDVPFGAFWFGWRESPFTPNGFDGWTTGKRPSAIHWPNAGRDEPDA